MKKITLLLVSSVFLVACSQKPAEVDSVNTDLLSWREVSNSLKPFGFSVFNDVEPCFNEFKYDNKTMKIDTSVKGPDDGYTIVILEDPIVTKNTGSTENGDKYVERGCFRNTFSYIDFDTNKPLVVPLVATTCSDNAKKLYTKWKDDSSTGVNYSCNAVQAILKKF